MGKRDLIFAFFFIVSLGVIFYFLGTSITGYAVHDQYCEDDVCKEFCSSNMDCKGQDEVCCTKGNFKVCEISSKCSGEYQLSFKLNDRVFHLESLDQLKKQDFFLGVIAISMVFLGALYILGKSMYD